MSESNQLKDASVSGLFYRFGERILAQLVSTVVTIVLARLLLPDEYGIINLIVIFIQICNVLVSDGLSSSLIQKKDADELDFSTIFWASMVLSIILYAIVFFASPFIAAFYNIVEITLVLRIMALRIPLTAFNSVQSAYVSKHLLFKKFFFATLIGTITSGVVGIILAYQGAGVWALVFQYLINSFMDTLFLFISVKWRPSFHFSFSRFKKLFSFGWKVLISGLLSETYASLRSLVIAKEYSSADLSYFSKGKQFPQLLGNNIGTTITNVMFPIFSAKQDDKENLKKMVRRTMSVGFYVLCPIMIGFAAIADTFVRLVLTDKWLPAVPFLQVFSFQFILKPLKNISKSSLKAVGRSDIDMYVNIMEKVIGIGLVILFMKKGPFVLAVTALITYVISTTVNMLANSKVLQYSIKDQLADMVPYVILAFISAVPAYFMNNWEVILLVKLIIQILSAVIIYIGLSKLFKLKVYTYCKDTGLHYINKLSKSLKRRKK